MDAARIQIAVVDDDPSFLRALERLLRAAGFVPLTYASGEAFLSEHPRAPLDCVIMDVRLGSMTGFDVARKLAAEAGGVPILFMTAHDDAAAWDEAQKLHCVAYMRKPFSAQSLLEAIRQATLSKQAVGSATQRRPEQAKEPDNIHKETPQSSL